MGSKFFFKYPLNNKFSIDNAIGSYNIKKEKKKEKEKKTKTEISYCVQSQKHYGLLLRYFLVSAKQTTLSHLVVCNHSFCKLYDRRLCIVISFSLTEIAYQQISVAIQIPSSLTEAFLTVLCFFFFFKVITSQQAYLGSKNHIKHRQFQFLVDFINEITFTHKKEGEEEEEACSTY